MCNCKLISILQKVYLPKNILMFSTFDKFCVYGYFLGAVAKQPLLLLKRNYNNINSKFKLIINTKRFRIKICE